MKKSNVTTTASRLLGLEQRVYVLEAAFRDLLLEKAADLEAQVAELAAVAATTPRRTAEDMDAAIRSAWAPPA